MPNAFEAFLNFLHHNGELISAYLFHHSLTLQAIARGLSVFALGFSCIAMCMVVSNLLRRGLVPFLINAFIVAWTVAAIFVMIRLPLWVVAELGLINLLIALSVLCWIFLILAPHIEELMVAIRSDSEVASNMVYLQGEMTRAQLEALSERIRQSTQPQEREITETVLKSISPVVMLFLRKEKSVMQWSMAAVNIGKNLMQYFWSPKTTD